MKFARLYIPQTPYIPVYKLEERLVAAFLGYTRLHCGFGAWVAPNGELLKEPVYVYDVCIEDEHGTCLSEILEEYKAGANQTAVLYVLDNKPIFL